MRREGQEKWMCEWINICNSKSTLCIRSMLPINDNGLIDIKVFKVYLVIWQLWVQYLGWVVHKSYGLWLLFCGRNKQHIKYELTDIWYLLSVNSGMRALYFCWLNKGFTLKFLEDYCKHLKKAEDYESWNMVTI